MYHEERRDFLRMTTESQINGREVTSGTSFNGQCINLSASGVLFSSEQQFDPGTMLDINISLPKAIVPPLDATIEVVRLDKQQQGYNVAGVFRQKR